MAKQLKGACFAANGHEKHQTACSCICSESMLPEKLQRLSSKEAKLHNVDSGSAYSLQKRMMEGFKVPYPSRYMALSTVTHSAGSGNVQGRLRGFPEERLWCGGGSFSLQEPILAWLGIADLCDSLDDGMWGIVRRCWQMLPGMAEWAHVTAPYGRV